MANLIDLRAMKSAWLENANDFTALYNNVFFMHINTGQFFCLIAKIFQYTGDQHLVFLPLRFSGFANRTDPTIDRGNDGTKLYIRTQRDCHYMRERSLGREVVVGPPFDKMALPFLPFLVGISLLISRATLTGVSPDKWTFNSAHL